LEQRLRVAERKGSAAGGEVRNVAGHQHSVVTHAAIGAQAKDQIHVAIVGEGLLKVQKRALDVSLLT
jgi:hypothetical protein